MIFDSVKNKENYKGDERIYKVLCYLDSLEQGELPPSNTVISADGIFCNPVSFTSKPEEECKYEAHKEYIDVHYIIKGTEGIATADVKSLSEIVPYDMDHDIAFYEGSASGRYLLKPGDFMVCFPSDAHKVAMMEKQPEKIEKIVAKIKVQ